MKTYLYRLPHCRLNPVSEPTNCIYYTNVMYCKFVHLCKPTTSIIHSSSGPRCCCVIWAIATIVTPWLSHKTNFCTFLLERRKLHTPMWPHLNGRQQAVLHMERQNKHYNCKLQSKKTICYQLKQSFIGLV